jgi:hypothetical protein
MTHQWKAKNDHQPTGLKLIVDSETENWLVTAEN